MKAKVDLIFGTRPEAIKVAPVFKALQNKAELETRLIATGQHRELLAQALSAFGLQATCNLDVMKAGQTLSQLTASLLTALESLYSKDKPQLILAHGDTTTCYAAALSAFYHGIPFFHLEAGLRTFRLNSPFPEEFNRQCITKMASHHFACSEAAVKNLLSDGISDDSITLSGNTLYDAINEMQAETKKDKLAASSFFKAKIAKCKSTVLMTLHRRARGTESLKPVMEAIKNVADLHPDTCFVYPVHPSPAASSLASEVFSSMPNVLLCPPLDYPDFLTLMANSNLILTDSGGVQEEAAYLGKSVLVLRDCSERNDGIERGSTEIVGTDPAQIFARTTETIKNLHTTSLSQVQISESPSQIIAEVVAQRCSA